MKTTRMLTLVNESEEELIAHFTEHPVFLTIMARSQESTLEMLLQRRFLSLGFTPLYDLAIDGLRDPGQRSIARQILREEYLEGDSTHREDLVCDLLALGATRDQILRSSPSAKTLDTLGRLLAMTRKEEPDDDLYQIKLLAMLRFGCEVLVAVEYEQLWPRIIDFRLPHRLSQSKSVFYYPHISHDARSPLLADRANLGARTHSDELGECLRDAITRCPSEGVDYCISVEKMVTNVKRAFYDQFSASN